MRFNAAIVASLTGAAFAYPVLESSKEIAELPVAGLDPNSVPGAAESPVDASVVPQAAAVPEAFTDLKDASVPQELVESKVPIQAEDLTNPSRILNSSDVADITDVLSDDDLNDILSTLNMGPSDQDIENKAVLEPNFNLPVGKMLPELLPANLDGNSDSLLAPLGLTGSVAGDATGSASAASVPVKRTLLFADKAESELTTSMTTATGIENVDEEEYGLLKRNAQFEALTILLAPFTGALDPEAGATAKREAQFSLDQITALLAPFTGAAAPGAAAKRQLGLDAVTGLLAPLTGAPAPGAPVKRDVSPADVVNTPNPDTSSQLEIQCIKSADGICKTTELDNDMFDPAAPQHYGSLDFVDEILALDYVKNLVPV